jgi:serine protease Do
MGIGFAIPSDMARSVMDSIIKHGKVIRGWLGVSIQNLTPEIAKSLGIKETAGALVGGVEKDSPADKAGMKRGDLIVQYNGKNVEDSTGLRNMVAGSEPGAKAEIRIVRDQKEQTLTVTLGEYQEKKAAKKIEFANALKGITVQELTPAIRDRMGIPENLNGVIIANISEDSPAQEALQPHDVIVEVNRKAITSISDYEQTVSKIGEKDSVLLLVYRDGASIYITIKP